MAINLISGSPQGPRLTPKVVAESVAPAAAQQLVPQDTLGITSKREPSKGLAPSTRLSDLKPEQKQALGGGSALDTIAESQPDTTVGELAPLLRNKGAMDSIAGLMAERRDLKIGDFVSTDKKGRTVIDPSYKDPKTLEMLKERQDITPSELTAMRQNMTKAMKDPQLGKMASEKAFDLLRKRSDLKPEDMSNMMGSFKNAVGGDPKKGQGGDEQAQAMAALDMFDNASKMMGKRSDIGPEQMGEMAQSVANLSSPKDKNGPQSISEGFEAASKSLEKNALRTPTDVAKTASTIGDHFKGGDEKTAGHRMNAFKKGAEMMGENTSVDHNSINKMLTQASQRDPKIGEDGEGAGRAKRLAKVMDDVSTGVKQGTVSANDLSSHFRNQDAERARFAPEQQKKDDKKTQKPGEEDKKTQQAGQDDKKPPQAGEQKTAQAGPTEEKKAEQAGAAGESKKSEPQGGLTDSQKEEMAVSGPPPQEGQGTTTDAGVKAAAKTSGPGQAAGTKEAGVAPGTSGTPGSPQGGGPKTQTTQPQILQPKKQT